MVQNHHLVLRHLRGGIGVVPLPELGSPDLLPSEGVRGHPDVGGGGEGHGRGDAPRLLGVQAAAVEQAAVLVLQELAPGMVQEICRKKQRRDSKCTAPFTPNS